MIVKNLRSLVLAIIIDLSVKIEVLGITLKGINKSPNN